jgi:hypothetical protein
MDDAVDEHGLQRYEMRAAEVRSWAIAGSERLAAMVYTEERILAPGVAANRLFRVPRRAFVDRFGDMFCHSGRPGSATFPLVTVEVRL